LVTYPTGAAVTDWGRLATFNDDVIDPDTGGPHESLLTIIAQRRAVDASPNARNRQITSDARDGLQRYDSIWRMLSAHCTYFKNLSATGYPAATSFESDEIKVAYSTGDVPIDPALRRGTFQCVDAAYLDSGGAIRAPQFRNRLDTGTQLRQFNTVPVNSDRDNGRVRFVQIDSDTCIGARLFADAMGGIHWKTSLGLNELGREARVSFFVGFADTSRALEMAEQVSSSRLGEESALNQALTDPAFKLKVYAIPLRYSSGAQAQTLARQVGPAALITTRGTFEQRTRNNIRPRGGVGITFREPFSETPLTETFIPWPLQDPTDVRSALLLRENAVIVDSSRFENSAANAWLNSFVGEQRSAEAAGIPANAVSINYDVFHTTELSNSANSANAPAHSLHNEDGRYDISGFSDELMRNSLLQMNTSVGGTSNVPSTASPTEKPEGIDNTAIPVVGGSSTGAVQTSTLNRFNYAYSGRRSPANILLWNSFGVQETNGVDRLWPRLLDIGSADAPLRSLHIRDHATFSQLRVRSGAQVRVIGDIAVGVTCESDVGVSDSEKAGGQGTAQNLIAYVPKVSPSVPRVVSSSANRYQPLCRDLGVSNEDATQAEIEADIPYIGLYMRPSSVDSGASPATRTSFFTETFDARGVSIPLSVRRESTSPSGERLNVLRYKGCVRDTTGQPASLPGTNNVSANPLYSLITLDIPGGRLGLGLQARQDPWGRSHNRAESC
jgi:hypothetical protein